MSQPTEVKDSVGDRVKLLLSYDVEKMLKEVDTLNLPAYEYYDSLPLRAPAHQIDPSIPFPPPADDYADGSWTEWKNSSQLEAMPYFKSIVEYFQAHTSVTLVRLLRLSPGSEIRPHQDPTLGLHIEKSVIRLTVPIAANDGVVFYLNDKPVNMELGECWYMRLTDTHKVLNQGATDRINLTIDMVPNAWVRELIANGE